MKIKFSHVILFSIILFSCQPQSEHRAKNSSDNVMARFTKELICELTSEYCKRDKNKVTCRSCKDLMVCGKRYAYIYQKDSNTFILNMNGVEVEGQFERWNHPLYCGTGVNWKQREQTKYQRVDYERSLTTFSFTDKEGNTQTYIDGIKVNNSLYKTYPVLIKDGLETIDTSIYILRKRKIWRDSSSLFFRGLKGPEFTRISSVKYSNDDSSFNYVGVSLEDRDTKYAVIDDIVYWDYPISKFTNGGYISKYRYGMTYFKYGNKQDNGFWIDGETFPCTGRPTEISFSSKRDFKFICKKNESAYYLVTRDSISRKYRYIGFKNETQRDPEQKMLMIDNDSIYCYQNDLLVYRSKFVIKGSLMHFRFERTRDKKTIVIRGSTKERPSFFGINDQWFMTKTPPPEGYVMHRDQKDLFKFLGFSETGNKYAYQEYVFDEETNLKKWANIYINDSLLGKFPHTIKFDWTIGDNYRLSDHHGRCIANRENGTQWLKDEYKNFVISYYPEGVPEIVYTIKPDDRSFEVEELSNKERYIRNMYGVLIRGKQIKHYGKTIKVGLLYNDKIYYTMQDENRTWLYVDWKMIYASDKIVSVTPSVDFLNFYSFEGNKVYWVKYTL